MHLCKRNAIVRMYKFMYQINILLESFKQLSGKHAHLHDMNTFMVLGQIQPLREMNIQNLPGVKGDRSVRLTIPRPSTDQPSRKM
jgi:hypothetical protein